MVSQNNKLINILMITILFLGGCKKEKNDPINFNQLVFGKEGKDFTFQQSSKMAGDIRTVSLSIPANSVNSSNELIEYYSLYLANKEDLNNYYINYWANDINLFRSTAVYLQQPAIIKIPFPNTNTYYANSVYKPYKVKLDGSKEIKVGLNNFANWELITDFTWDNSEKCIIIQTTDLNAAYILARHK